MKKKQLKLKKRMLAVTISSLVVISMAGCGKTKNEGPVIIQAQDDSDGNHSFGSGQGALGDSTNISTAKEEEEVNKDEGANVDSAEETDGNTEAKEQKPTKEDLTQYTKSIVGTWSNIALNIMFSFNEVELLANGIELGENGEEVISDEVVEQKTIISFSGHDNQYSYYGEANTDNSTFIDIHRVNTTKKRSEVERPVEEDFETEEEYQEAVSAYEDTSEYEEDVHYGIKSIAIEKKESGEEKVVMTLIIDGEECKLERLN